MTQATFSLSPDGTQQFFTLPFTVQSVQVNNQSSAIVSVFQNDSTQTLEMQAGAGQDVEQNVSPNNRYIGQSASASTGTVTLTFSDAPASPSSTSGPSAVQTFRQFGLEESGSIQLSCAKYRYGQVFMQAPSLPPGSDTGVLTLFTVIFIASGNSLAQPIQEVFVRSDGLILRADFGQGAILQMQQSGRLSTNITDTFLGESIILQYQDTFTGLLLPFYYNVVMLG